VTVSPSRRGPWITRQRLIGSGLTAGAAIVVGAYELVDHGELPGRHALDELDGACSVDTPRETFAATGATISGRFYSHARQREVGYSIAYPPHHRPGDHLPLGLFLHAHGGDHRTQIGRLTPAHALAGNGIAPFALATFDGGNLYWNPHPGDDPMAMIVDEILPLCRDRGLGRRPGTIAALGVSMGGFGALLLAEKHPGLLSSAAAISPAVWTSYAQAAAVDTSAFASAADFTRDDLVTHADALSHLPIRIASGSDDPFHPGVVALARRLGPKANVVLTSGCHDGEFTTSQQHQTLRFLAQHFAT
jgi:pimeloyl-ACP methyl ester carboxylesterase